MDEANRSNAKTQTDALESHFQKIIEQMDDPFTFHGFVLLLAKKHQREYIGALVEHRDKDTPFRALHAELERRLHSNADRYGIHLLSSEYPSSDIFGSSSSCGQWQKIKP